MASNKDISGHKPIKTSKADLIKVSVVLTIVLLVIAFIGFLIFGGEGFKRFTKSFKSNYSGGIYRTVEVYDINGNIIKSYSGKFDISYDSNRILFDDEDGKRHTVYYTTGTIVIDEE